MNVTITTLVGIVVRHGLTLVAGATGVSGLASGETVQLATAVVSGGIALGLSIWQKVQSAKAAAPAA